MKDTDGIANEVAERVRALLVDAERRAAEIVREAEAEARRIREGAEAEGQERLAEARKVLADLETRLAGAGGSSEVDPGPVTVPEPTPDPVPEPRPAPVPEPRPEPVPEPTPQRVPEPTPPPDEGDLPGTTAARLVAMNMALGGSSREEIDAALADGYEIDDRATLIDEVLAKAAG